MHHVACDVIIDWLAPPTRLWSCYNNFYRLREMVNFHWGLGLIIYYGLGIFFAELHALSVNAVFQLLVYCFFIPVIITIVIATFTEGGNAFMSVCLFECRIQDQFLQIFKFLTFSNQSADPDSLIRIRSRSWIRNPRSGIQNHFSIFQNIVKRDILTFSG